MREAIVLQIEKNNKHVEKTMAPDVPGCQRDWNQGGSTPCCRSQISQSEAARWGSWDWSSCWHPGNWLDWGDFGWIWIFFGTWKTGLISKLMYIFCICMSSRSCQNFYKPSMSPWPKWQFSYKKGIFCVLSCHRFAKEAENSASRDHGSYVWKPGMGSNQLANLSICGALVVETNSFLGGGFKYFLFSPLFGDMIHFD